jgi:hypothetical protein
MKKAFLTGIGAAILLSLTANSMAAVQKVNSIEFVNKTPVSFVCTTYTEKFLGTKAKVTLGANYTGNINHIGANESWSCQPLTKKGYMAYSVISKFNSSKPGELQVTLAPTT